MKTPNKKFAVLAKNFTVNGVIFEKGHRFTLRKGNMFDDGVGFDRNGNFVYAHYFGYGKYLNIPAEYFAK